MYFYKYTPKAILSKLYGHALIENMNEEGIRKRIRTLLEAIQNEADPVLLNRCRSIFRQEVSFFRRSYMAAYLLLLAEGEKAIDSGISAARGRGVVFASEGKRREKNRGKEHLAEASRFLSEEESVKLFVSIGRNRKVFPREILAFINANTRISKDDIGIIRILDNYSFVQVRTAVADTVIQALNGRNFRGRTLTVNYARSRRDEEEGAQSSVPPGPEGEASSAEIAETAES
jgi:hypothetical protein